MKDIESIFLPESNNLQYILKNLDANSHKINLKTEENNYDI